MSEVCYSITGEDYTELCLVMEQLRDEHEIGDSVEVFQGISTPIGHNGFIFANTLIEHMQDRAWEEYGEWSEGYLDNITKDQKLQLENLISAWFTRNVPTPTFYKVIGVQKIMLEVEL